ncbi:hypothetical protein GGF38_003309, partial [Coemansia sp. RSA 25]
ISGLFDVAGLTHIVIEDQACMEDCVELVRRNASTLVSVDLGIVDAPDFLPQLVTDDEGNAIVYPHLRKLAIHMTLLPKDMSAVFPALEDLKCTTGSLRIANVGHLSDNELDDELRNTLGGEDANSYLSGILGSALFSDGAAKQGGEDGDEEEDEEAAGRVSTPAIKPQRDAIDYSDFNELAADDAAVPRKEKWSNDGLNAGFKFGTTVERAQVDDDYDDDEDEPLPANEAEQAEFAGSDEEILEDLFDSPEIKPADGDSSGRRISQRLASPEEESTPALASPEEPEEEEAVVPRPAKRIIPSGPIKFTDYFGCHVTRQVKRRRRQPPAQQPEEDEDADGRAEPPTVVDTRRLLAGAQSLLPVRSQPGFVRAVVAQSMADDTSCDVYVTVDGRTGAETSQRTVPRRAADPAQVVFQDTAYPLALDDWERRITWGDGNDDDKEDKEDGAQPDGDVARQVLAQTGGELASDFEAHVIWDTDTAFLPSTRLQINLSDPHMLLESGGGETKRDT